MSEAITFTTGDNIDLYQYDMGHIGFVTTTYKKLVQTFGPPEYGPNLKYSMSNLKDGDESCQWVIKFSDGTLACIYDKSTCGKTVRRSYEWRVGGNRLGGISRRDHDPYTSVEETHEEFLIRRAMEAAGAA